MPQTLKKGESISESGKALKGGRGRNSNFVRTGAEVLAGEGKIGAAEDGLKAWGFLVALRKDIENQG